MPTSNSCRKISHHEVFLVEKRIETIPITQLGHFRSIQLKLDTIPSQIFMNFGMQAYTHEKKFTANFSV